MPIYDYECCMCGNIKEVITSPDDIDDRRCPSCEIGMARRIISASGRNCANQDAGWIRSAAEVAGTETVEGKEFKRNPTRDNMHAWMKAKGLRHMDPGEKPRKPEPVNEQRMAEALFERHRKRMAITIG
jgi:putative FmdB family regulatory protein